jgi:hypothetical protein
VTAFATRPVKTRESAYHEFLRSLNLHGLTKKKKILRNPISRGCSWLITRITLVIWDLIMLVIEWVAAKKKQEHSLQYQSPVPKKGLRNQTAILAVCWSIIQALIRIPKHAEHSRLRRLIAGGTQSQMICIMRIKPLLGKNDPKRRSLTHLFSYILLNTWQNYLIKLDFMKYSIFYNYYVEIGFPQHVTGGGLLNCLIYMKRDTIQ